MVVKNFNKAWLDEPQFTTEGTLEYAYGKETFDLWYGKVGINKKPPLLVLHGGPGGSHSNLVPLQALGDEREIIFYDQLGCGYSEKPDNPSLWNIERYVEEVKAVVDKLSLKQYHLLGHSWGGMLTTAFSHKYPEGILSLSLMSPILNMPLYVNGTRLQLRGNLTPGYVKVIDEYELQGKGDPEEYRTALMQHLQLHICKLFPNPPSALTRLSHLAHRQVHDEMIGVNCTSELNILGNLREVNVAPLLKEIHIPILFSCGDVECCPPKDVRTYVALVKNASFHVFNGCRHMTMLEEPEEFVNLVGEFISKKDT